ncbi:hypothetical protein HDU97_001008 [Phlyctochytrium planicorne]|nr:hypothetical protein HDU97_001008 [Phlyctochytrium planicorne]
MPSQPITVNPEGVKAPSSEPIAASTLAETKPGETVASAWIVHEPPLLVPSGLEGEARFVVPDVAVNAEMVEEKKEVVEKVDGVRESGIGVIAVGKVDMPSVVVSGVDGDVVVGDGNADGGKDSVPVPLRPASVMQDGNAVEVGKDQPGHPLKPAVTMQSGKSVKTGEDERTEQPKSAPPPPPVAAFVPEARPGVGQWSPSPKPLPVKLIEHWVLPLPGGTKLSTRVWMPKDALAGKRFPGILEFIPYRKRDFTAQRDEIMHPFFASRGYVSVRCDMRGTGDSTGTLEDEYTPQELEDASAVIKHIASAPWCTGSVGMMGKSWGGFNSLQVACLQPADLKAIITVCSTDDRYADDIHHLGGCLLTDNLTWSGFMLKHCPLPPDPAVFEGTVSSWRKTFLHRLQNTSPWIIQWMKHQRRDWFYKHGSVCEDFSRIKIPVFAVGGWADSYTRPIFNLMERLDVPRKALVGPWAHLYPHQGVPGPSMNFLEECVRWWDEWLKNSKTGIMDEAPCQVYIQDAVPPSNFVATRPGFWVGLSGWPSNQVEVKEHYLGRNGMLVDEKVVGLPPVLVRNNLRVGQGAPRFCAFGSDPELAYDQGEDDAGSTCFDSEPFEYETTYLGSPYVNVTVTVNKPNAILVARICDVDPATQESFLIGWAPFNLTHHISHSNPAPLHPNTPIHARIPMKHVSHVMKPGRVLRLALSTSYWPLVWPSPSTADVVLVTEECSVGMPLLLGVGDALVSQHVVERARGCQPRPFTVLRNEMPAQVLRTKDRNKRFWVKDYGAMRFDSDGWVYGESSQESFYLLEHDPTSAHVECRWRVECGRPANLSDAQLASLGQIQSSTMLAEPFVKDNEKARDWRGIVRIEAKVKMSCNEKEFCVDAEIRGFENGRVVAEGRWEDVRVPRDLV